MWTDVSDDVIYSSVINNDTNQKHQEWKNMQNQ